MKEILNEWRKFVNENEQIGEEYYIKSMTPTTQEEFLKEYLADAAGFVKRKIINTLLNLFYRHFAQENVAYYKLELSNGEKYFAAYIPERNKMEVISLEPTDDPKQPLEMKKAEEELEAAALKFLQQDAPYENSPRFPEDEEK